MSDTHRADLLDPGVRVVTLPTEGMAAGTKVLTLDGVLPVQFLSPGDRVVTRGGARTLLAIEVSVCRDARLIRIPADALGPERPDGTVYLAPDQALHLRDWRAEAMSGQAAAVLPAQRMIDGALVTSETFAEVRMYTLRFEKAEIVYAGGMELVCPPTAVAA
jgi:hypothetical protein